MNQTVRMALALLAFVLAGSAAGQALRVPPMPAEKQAPPAEVRLIEGWQAADGTHVAAVEIRLAPGWHTYWRMPGEAGMPPVLDWSRSRNLASVRHEWPRPILFESYGMQTIGYAGELVLPVVLTPERPGEPIEAALDLIFGVCDEICIPAEARLDVQLTPGRPPRGKARIEAARADRPVTPQEAGVTAVTCGLDAGAHGPELVADVTFASDQTPGKVLVIEPGRDGLRIGPAESRTSGRIVSARAPVRGGGAGGPAIDRGALRLTVIGPNRAVDIRGCRAPG
jgi:DsbC/DsbD-like thiol-disulfide interchange protein